MSKKSILEDIQARGPASKTVEGYDTWYDEIYQAAKGVFKIAGEAGDTEQAETVGDWDPIKREWVGGKHESIYNVCQEEI